MNRKAGAWAEAPREDRGIGRHVEPSIRELPASGGRDRPAPARARGRNGQERLGVRSEAFAQGAATFEAIVSVVTDRIDASLLARMPRLRIVANVAVGYDNVDVAACDARGVVVTNTPGVLTDATADLAFGLLLAAARRVAEGDRLVRRGAFAGWTPSFLVGPRVHGATLGLVGLGRIGQAMARRARGFGMQVIYAARARASHDVERALRASQAPLDDLFALADFVSLHCPLTPETRHLVNAERLARMKAGAVLVNTARGACVDEAALAVALREGPLAAAGLDVFEDEPRSPPRAACARQRRPGASHRYAESTHARGHGGHGNRGCCGRSLRDGHRSTP